MKKAPISVAVALVMAVFVSVCEAQTPTGSVSVSSLTPMSLSVPYGYCNWSSKATFDFTRLVPAGKRNSYYDFSCSTQSASGAIAASGLRIICGIWQADFNWYGGGGTTSVFRGDPADVKCTTQFYACCNGTPYGGGSCSASIGSCRMTNYYY